MRSPRSALAIALVSLASLPGCLGGGSSAQGPTTLGDQGRTVWQISDGLCGGGIFGSECDLTRQIATGAAPLVQVRGHNGTSLDGATLMGGTGVTVTSMSSTTDDHGTLLEARVGSDVAARGDVIILDASGHEIDRAHITWVAPASLLCGALRSGVTRDVTFAGLTNAPVDVTMMPMETTTTTTLACRANDASGNALLSVDAIRWTVASGAVGTISVTSDDLFGTTPAEGATARLVTSGVGHATVHAALGSASADVAVTFH